MYIYIYYISTRIKLGEFSGSTREVLQRIPTGETSDEASCAASCAALCCVKSLEIAPIGPGRLVNVNICWLSNIVHSYYSFIIPLI